MIHHVMTCTRTGTPKVLNSAVGPPIIVAVVPVVYSKGESWGTLKKAWRGYKVAKVQKNTEDMKKYAERIRALQIELGLIQAKFPELGLN